MRRVRPHPVLPGDPIVSVRHGNGSLRQDAGTRNHTQHGLFIVLFFWVPIAAAKYASGVRWHLAHHLTQSALPFGFSTMVRWHLRGRRPEPPRHAAGVRWHLNGASVNNDQKSYLFVYGTLMSGERGHGLLGGAAWVRHDRTTPEYTLVRIDWYPALVRGGNQRIAGEVYLVPPHAWGALDEYEECPELYERVCITLQSGLETYTYALRHNPGHPEIATGDWRRR